MKRLPYYYQTLSPNMLTLYATGSSWSQLTLNFLLLCSFVTVGGQPHTL